MSSDFNDPLSSFDAHEVRYLVVGGHAVMFYSEPRYTKDLDIGVDVSADNAARSSGRSPNSALRSKDSPLLTSPPQARFINWDNRRCESIFSRRSKA